MERLEGLKRELLQDVFSDEERRERKQEAPEKREEVRKARSVQENSIST